MSTSREELPVLDPFEMLLDAARYAERIKPEWSRAAKRSVAQARLAATPKAAVDREALELCREYLTGSRRPTPLLAFGGPPTNSPRGLVVQAIDAALSLPSVLGGVDQKEAQTTKPSPSRASDSVTETAVAIHSVLMSAGIEYSALSTSGTNLFGDSNSIKAAKSWLHSHGQIDDLKTNLRHWRDECGKLHAKLAQTDALPPDNAGLVSGGGK